MRFRPRLALLWASILLVIVVGLAALGVRGDWSELPALYTFGTIAVALIGAAAMSAMSMSRGPSMVGPRAELLLVTPIVTVLGLAIWTVLVQATGTHTRLPPEAWIGRIPIGCDAIATLLALPVLGLGLWARRGLTPASSVLTGVVLGGASGVWSFVVVHAHCPIGGRAHALAGHVAPVIGMMLIGAIASTWYDRRALSRSTSR